MKFRFFCWNITNPTLDYDCSNLNLKFKSPFKIFWLLHIKTFTFHGSASYLNTVFNESTPCVNVLNSNVVFWKIKFSKIEKKTRERDEFFSKIGFVPISSKFVFWLERSGTKICFWTSQNWRNLRNEEEPKNWMPKNIWMPTKYRFSFLRK